MGQGNTYVMRSAIDLVSVMRCAIWYHLCKLKIVKTSMEECFSRFLNYVNSTKSRNASHMKRKFAGLFLTRRSNEFRKC